MREALNSLSSVSDERFQVIMQREGTHANSGHFSELKKMELVIWGGRAPRGCRQSPCVERTSLRKLQKIPSSFPLGTNQFIHVKK